MKTSPEEAYNQRLKRVFDAVHLKQPDRVPLVVGFQAFPEYTYGVSIAEAMYDYDKVAGALDQFYEEYQPDLAWDPVFMYPGKVLDILDIKWLRWPGSRKYDLDPNTMYQFIENENMKEDEYDELIFDPTHFIQSKWIPRSFGALKPLEKLRLRGSLWVSFLNSFAVFADKDVQGALKALVEAGEELVRWNQFLADYDRKLEAKGFPVAYGAFGFAPFDMLGDSLRGTVPVLTDLFDYPDEILQVTEKFTKIALESAIDGCKVTGRPFVWIWLHKGLDEFMSDAQYKKFYWPSLQKYLVGLVDAGLTPVVYCEGKYNTRLEILRDVPVGKIIYNFETVDMFKAKEVLGDVACIAGNVPNYLLSYGTVEEVKDYCKKLIDICGKGGGFIMDSSALIDDAKPENLKAMFEFTQSYGVY